MTPGDKLAYAGACLLSIALTLCYFNLADEVGWGDARHISDKELANLIVRLRAGPQGGPHNRLPLKRLEREQTWRRFCDRWLPFARAK